MKLPALQGVKSEALRWQAKCVRLLRVASFDVFNGETTLVGGPPMQTEHVTLSVRSFMKSNWQPIMECICLPAFGTWGLENNTNNLETSTKKQKQKVQVLAIGKRLKDLGRSVFGLVSLVF